METISPVRKRLTVTQGKELARRYQQSGLTPREFAQQQRIHLARLQYWLGRAEPPPRTAAAFIPVPNLLAAPPGPPAYRLRWPDGLQLELAAGFGARELGTLLAVIHRL